MVIKLCQLRNVSYISEESIGAFFDGLLTLFKIWYIHLDGLTEQEKASLAKMWKPAFQRYLSEKFAVLVIPAIATIGLFAPKVIKSRRTKKAKQEKEDNKDEKES